MIYCTQNLYQNLPKLLNVTSKKPERKFQIKIRALLAISIFLTPLFIFLFCSPLLSSSQDDLCFANSVSFQSPSILTLIAKKVSLNVLFHTGTVGDTNQKEKEFLASCSPGIFLCPYDDYFQPYCFHDYFLGQFLISAHVPPSELRIWNLCLGGF